MTGFPFILFIYLIKHSSLKKTMKGKKVQVMEGNIAMVSKIKLWLHAVQRLGFFFLIGMVSTGICLVSAEVLMTTDFESGTLSG